MHAKQRIANGKSSKVIDLSVYDRKKLAQLQLEQRQEDEAEHRLGVHNANAFLDM